jgi:hypothetical protein
MPTLKELFKEKIISSGKTAEEEYAVRNSKDIRISTANGILNSTVFPIVQSTLRSSGVLTNRKKETLIEQETTGLRAIRGLSIPVLYGSELIRITSRTTNIKTDMLSAANGGDVDNGIVGNLINRVKDKALQITSKLGIAFPETVIPTRLSLNGKFREALEPDTMRVLAEIKNDAAGNLVGKFLAQNAKGTPNQIGRQVIGVGIDAVKGVVRRKLFGSPLVGAQNLAQKDPNSVQYDRVARYSNTVFPQGELGIRNDLSTLLNERNSRLLEIKKAGDTGEKLIAGANIDLLNPPKNQLPTLTDSQFGNIGNKVKGIELKNRGGLSIARKQGQRELSKTENITDEFQYTEIIAYSDTVDERNDEIPLRRDLSSKLDELLNDETTQISPVNSIRREDRYSNKSFDVKTLTQRTIGGELSYGNEFSSSFGDFVNSKPPYKPNSEGNLEFPADKSILDDYDFIPIKFISLLGGKAVNFTAIVDGVSETFSPQWDTAKFLGSPFNYYNYTGIDRSVSFDLKLFSLNPAEHVIMWQKIDFLTSLVYPIGYDDSTTYVKPPFLRFTLGSMYKNKVCFIASLSYTVDDQAGWETGLPINGSSLINVFGENVNMKDYKLPRQVSVSIGLTFIESRDNTQQRKYGYNPINFSDNSIKNIK